MVPPWLKVLEEWRARGPNFGLSVPYVLGAHIAVVSKCPPGLPGNFDQLYSLFESIRDETPLGQYIRLYSCEKVGDLVLAPLPTPPGHCVGIESKKRLDFALYIEDGLVKNSEKVFDELIEELWRRFGSCIEAGRFSRIAQRYQDFSPSDIELIEAASRRSDDVEFQ